MEQSPHWNKAPKFEAERGERDRRATFQGATTEKLNKIKDFQPQWNKGNKWNNKY